MLDTPAETLCVECNFCCDGSLFSSVVIADEEETRLRPVLELRREDNGDLRLPQRCSQLRPTGMCGCYADRPKTCAGFQCDLLKAVEAEFVSVDDALSIIDEAKHINAMTTRAFSLAMPKDAWDPTIIGGLQAGLAYMESVPGDGLDDVDKDIASIWASYVTYIRAHFDANFSANVER